MRNLLALVAILVIGFCTACYYRGWCSVEPLSSDVGKSAFRVEVDRIKIAQDIMEGAKAIQRALNTEQDKSKSATEKTTEAETPKE